MTPLERIEQLRWRDLSPALRFALSGKLAGLYGYADDAAAFEYLSVEKQQPLLMMWRRYSFYGLTPSVRKIENVWGIGGIGFEYAAYPDMRDRLLRHPNFTRHLAKHNSTGGFRELKTAIGALHILYTDRPRIERFWTGHLDWYNPLSNPLNTARHIWRESARERTPNWFDLRYLFNELV